MKRPRNPFPAPCMRHAGSCNLWDTEDVAAWEQRERAYARMHDDLGYSLGTASLDRVDQRPVIEPLRTRT